MPGPVRAVKYGRVRLATEVVAGAHAATSDDYSTRRRSSFVCMGSTDRVETDSGGVEEVSVLTYGLVLHYVYVFEGGSPPALACLFLPSVLALGVSDLGSMALQVRALGSLAVELSGGDRGMSVLLPSMLLWARSSHHIRFPRDPVASF